MNEVEYYAVALVAEGAESLAEDDTDENDVFESTLDADAAAELGVKMARAISANQEEFLAWYRAHAV